MRINLLRPSRRQVFGASLTKRGQEMEPQVCQKIQLWRNQQGLPLGKEYSPTWFLVVGSVFLAEKDKLVPAETKEDIIKFSYTYKVLFFKSKGV